jgi:ABC-2 type transport system ATP-binding protein
MAVTPIEVRGVTKRYGDFVAVDDISFAVSPGTIFGLLGPNGAGKTTTIRMIMNITIPDSGSIHLMGEPSTEEASRRIGYLPEERGLYKKMKVIDQLIFLGEIRGLTEAEARKRATAWLERMGAGSWQQKKIEELSKGMQQKIQFIGCVLHEPQIIILDEPFSGLDPVNARVLRDEVLRFKTEGKTVIFSTHVMEQAEKMCDEIALINRSRLVLNGSVRDVIRQHSGNRMIVHSSNLEALRAVEGVRDVVQKNGLAEVELDAATSAAEFLRRATQTCDIDSAVSHELSLDEIFVNVVGADAATREDA